MKLPSRRKLLGAFLLSLPFLVIAGLMCHQHGLGATLVLFGTVGAMVGVAAWGAKLFWDE